MKSHDGKTLSELSPGNSGKVIRINTKGPLRRRILDMGIVPGIEVSVKGMAPLGDPIELIVRGYSLSLRKQEAENILVEVI
ncbi:MAG: ferrous iron transport protein A [Clostridiales bacterium]|nr:ferrous iron transport protein A [Clostridiales bacterium]MCF8023472.1 ferrous iron transport protein A [Clostridiales bacterium]